MAKAISRTALFTDLRERVSQHSEAVQEHFLPLTEPELNCRPAAGEWSMLQCFDHLNKTDRFYLGKIRRLLVDPKPSVDNRDSYRASFWAGIYMRFAFNPKSSFPAPKLVVPDSTVSKEALNDFLALQERLLDVMMSTEGISLVDNLTQVATGIRFNLGDYLKILVYHDGLHVGQALRVRDACA